MEGTYRVLSHTADTGVEADGESFESVLAATAVGMFATMYDVAVTAPTHEVTVSIPMEGPIDEVLVDALAELLWRSEVDDVVFTSIAVTRDPGDHNLHLATTAVPTAGMELRGAPVKAVTYHDLEVVERAPGRWRARVYFDT